MKKREAVLFTATYYKRAVAEVCLRCPRSASACPETGCAEYHRAHRAAARPIRRSARIRRGPEYAD